MKNGLLGKKLGMTQVFSEEGSVIPVTVVEAGPCAVLQVKTRAKDGYDAIQVGFDDIAARKVNKPQAGRFEKAGCGPKRFVRELRVDSVDGVEAGSQMTVSLFAEGEKVDVVGTSKGRGFSGAMKRHGFAGKGSSHGTHKVHRKVGSIGMAAWPARVLKGKRMPGQYGNKRITVRNLEIVQVVPEKNLLLIKGSVPGPNGGYLLVKK